MIRRIAPLALAVAAVLALAGSALPAPSATPAELAYRIIFTGSGAATSNYPASPDGTTFTSTISWRLVYDIRVAFPIGAPGSPWLPAPGSAIEGGSTGVESTNGDPIEPGCQRIGFALDATQPGASFASRKGRLVSISLAPPGFQSGALLRYAPGQCSNPFPAGTGGEGCANAAAYTNPTVALDTTRQTQAWTVSGQCDVPDDGQTAHWSGTVTATSIALPVVAHFAGQTAQVCSGWDHNCRAGTHLTISFDINGNQIRNVRAIDEGGCTQNRHSQNGITPPPGTIAKDGSFRLAYTALSGAYRAEVRGKITGNQAAGTLSSTERYNGTTGTLDPRGTVLCHTASVRWSARKTG